MRRRCGAGHAARLAALLLATPLVASGCSGDPQERYCERVAEHQGELTEIAASEKDDALFDALPAYRDLADAAPDDVAARWDRVVASVEGLEEAVRGGDDREIEAASRELGARESVEAMASLEQHALDVCGTPLSR